MTVAKIVAEIVAILVSLVIIEWLLARMVKPIGLWPVIACLGLYLGIRAFLFARRQRPRT